VRLTRRHLLASATAAALAGCNGDDATATPTRATTGGTATETAAATGTAEPATDGAATPTDEGPTLDLREANVTAVTVARESDGVRFDVTLYHDDDGEEGYANWWQVERLDGTRLGRRDLLHAHGTREFTRSTTVSVPDGVTCVVVRGHDETHGYGGRAVLANLDSGATRGVRQGTEPRRADADECP
jgi:hypothetical protein